ncbi:MAG: DNA-binding protein [Nitrososphaeria archaeon]|nr:DNA-binding protein [Nitrososphaeria archaeon]
MCAYAPSQPSKEEEKQLKLRIIRTFLTPEARQRLNNVRMVKPEVAEFVENQIVQLVLSGKLKRQITDEEIKEILSNIAERERREFRIRRV